VGTLAVAEVAAVDERELPFAAGHLSSGKISIFINFYYFVRNNHFIFF
jgi:hypothetical protein